MHRLLIIQLFCFVHITAFAEQPSMDAQETQEPFTDTKETEKPSIDERETEQPSDVVDFGQFESPRGTTVVVADEVEAKRKQRENLSSVDNKRGDADAQPTTDIKPSVSDPDGPPNARVGNVQIINRVGVQFPFGSFRKGSDVSYIKGIGFRSLLEIGYKLTPNWFLGGYLDENHGFPGEVLDEVCEAEDYTCISRVVGIGLDVQYHLFPAERWNPWFAYLFGISYATTSTGFFGGDVSVGALSFDFFQLSSGVDLRLGRVFGIGIYAEYAAGFYFTEARIEDGEAESSDIDETVLHHNVGFGLHLVFLP